MKKYLALALLISFAGVHGADGAGGADAAPRFVRSGTPPTGDGKMYPPSSAPGPSTLTPTADPVETEHPQTWAELAQSKRPVLMGTAAVAGLGYWKFVKGESDWSSLTREALESAAVAFGALVGVQEVERQMVKRKILKRAVVGPFLDRDDVKGQAARAGFGLAVGAFAAHKDLSPLSGDINPVDVAMRALGN